MSEPKGHWKIWVFQCGLDSDVPFKGGCKTVRNVSVATLPVYFQTDLSASQRCPLNSFVNASTTPWSSFWAPSSSPLESLARLRAGPEVSSAVEMAGLETHRTSRSDPPGFSDATSAVTSSVSVRSSAG